MEGIRIGDVAAAAGGVLLAGSEGATVSSVGTDTRSLAPGGCFIALAGPRYDGNSFLEEAALRGAAALVFSREISESQKRAWAGRGVALVRVRDTLAAYHGLARWYRRLFRARVVAVTGSNGKTTTKEMICAAAAPRFTALCNEGTLNNHVGVPRTLLALERRHTLAVVELGMSARGEIGRLARIAAPDIGVITNVGPAHLQFLGSVDNVAASKAELLEAMEEEGAAGRLAVLNADDARVAPLAGRFGLEARTFGMSEGAAVRGGEVRAEGEGVGFTVRFARTGRAVRVHMPVMGRYNVMNALAAAAVSDALGVTGEEIAGALAEFRPPPMRMEILRRDGITLINDAYNANPASVGAALETLEGMRGARRKIFVMGDMLELGPFAGDAHREIGRRVAGAGIDIFVAVGELSAHAASAARAAGMPAGRVIECRGAREAAEAVGALAAPGDCVLLKASRKIGLERILDDPQIAQGRQGM